MLGDAKVDEHGNVFDTKDSNVMYLDKDGEDREINVNTSSVPLFLFPCLINLIRFMSIQNIRPFDTNVLDQEAIIL